MDRVTIYLRTSLFTVGGPKGHVPNGVMVVEGMAAEAKGGAIAVETDRLLDHHGKELSDASLSLQLPWAKIDHVVVHAD